MGNARNLNDSITNQQQAKLRLVPGSKRSNTIWGELRHFLRPILKTAEGSITRSRTRLFSTGDEVGLLTMPKNTFFIHCCCSWSSGDIRDTVHPRVSHHFYLHVDGKTDIVACSEFIARSSQLSL